MAQSGRDLVRLFAELFGLDAGQVSSLTLEGDARYGVLQAHVDLFPELTPEQLEAFRAQVQQFGSQLIVHVESQGK